MSNTITISVPTPVTVEALEEALIAAVAGYIRTHGCAVAAPVGSRGLDDREVVILLRPWEADEAELRGFASLAVQGWDSAGQFSPGLPALSFGEAALLLADEADADPGVCYNEDGSVHSYWRSGAIRLD